MALPASTNQAIAAGSRVTSATPSTMTGFSASSVVTVHRGSAARLRALTDRPPHENHSRPSCQTPHTGDACGRPSGRTVDTQ